MEAIGFRVYFGSKADWACWCDYKGKSGVKYVQVFGLSILVNSGTFTDVRKPKGGGDLKFCLRHQFWDAYYMSDIVA